MHFGGAADEKTQKIMPTILENVTFYDAVMREEIFGPVLPVLEAETFDDIKKAIAHNPEPLALYYFCKDKKQAMRAVKEISFGGGCINDTVIHLVTHELGFGGVGESGMGAYHGRRSFESFTRRKSIVNEATWIDLPIRFAPFGNKIRLLRKLM